MSKRPSGRTTTWVWFPYFSVAVAYPVGSGLLTVGSTSISTSAGIFQKYLPSNNATIPSGMNCLYCCQFWIVIFVPGGIAGCSPAVSCASAEDQNGHRIKLTQKRNLRAQLPITPSPIPDAIVTMQFRVCIRFYSKIVLTSGRPCADRHPNAFALRGVYLSGQGSATSSPE